MKIRLSLSSAITLFGLVLTVGFASVVLTGAFALKELKVGGPLYSSIKLGNDLVADILPPPAYVIEAYLEATLALREPKALASHETKLVQLKKDYDDRKAFWTTSELQPALKSMLVETSDAEVRKFWRNLETELLPALRAQDNGKAEAAYARLSETYSAHRAAIDALVEKANKQNSDMEAVAGARGPPPAPRGGWVDRLARRQPVRRGLVGLRPGARDRRARRSWSGLWRHPSAGANHRVDEVDRQGRAFDRSALRRSSG
jgi:hypothetical protein